MRRLAIAVLLAAVVVRSAAGQASSAGNRALYVGLAATVVPTAAGVALLAGTRGTVPGVVLMTSGVLLGPAIGDWTGGLTRRGLVGFGLRTAALSAGFLPLLITCSEDCNDVGVGLGLVAMAAVGAAAAIGHASWDLATVKGAVRRHEGQRVSVIPAYDPVRRAPAMVVRVKF